MAVWRLLTTGPADGATNMATDEAVLLAIAQGAAPPTVRFYSWKPPCVSVGYAQALDDEIDLAACRERGYTWVRRPTGGRAVLHIDELTYSVGAPQTDERVEGDILTSYRRLSRGLVSGLRLLGCQVAQAGFQENAGAAPKSAACFDVPSHYEVTALGRKLVGSAQVRRRGVVLQHGALPLTGDVARLSDVLAIPQTERQRIRAKLRERAVSLEEALGRPVSFEETAQALTIGFSAALNLRLVPGELSASERVTVARLREVYSADQWTFSR